MFAPHKHPQSTGGFEALALEVSLNQKFVVDF
jgi:hypothetical protein